ncbi:MAG: DUF4337 domain-containing protein [Alphaproteobacteria bacterium]|nr:DUF4337 domain-containing protein [Alphaproteobacteria bacterium]
MAGGHAHVEGGNKKIAILIAVLAAFLALSETAGKSAQTNYLTLNIEASNLWAFFQAKTIRQTAVRTAAEEIRAVLGPDMPAPQAERVQRQLAAWQAAVERWESEPPTQEGRRELMARAQAAEARRDRAFAAYHQFEYSSAAYQLAIVLASASVVTGVAMLGFAAGGLGIVGIAFALLGWIAPTLIHL